MSAEEGLCVLTPSHRLLLDIVVVEGFTELGSVGEYCRAPGWAECNEELELGVHSIAMPICNRQGQTVAALSLSVRAERMTMSDFRTEHLQAITQARDHLAATPSFE